MKKLSDKLEDLEKSKPILGARLFLDREDLLQLEKWGQIFRRFTIPGFGTINATLSKTEDESKAEVVVAESFKEE